MSYLLITPARDEMDGLPELLAAIEGQEITPALWLVIDDGSIDGSFEWLESEAKERDWFAVMQAPEQVDSGEYLGHHIAELKSFGMKQVQEMADARGIEYSAAGVLDADIICPPEHYAQLLETLEGDAKIGITSSVIESVYPDGTIKRESLQRADLPRGGTQFFRKECLEEIGGLPHWMGYDGIANARARMAGWKLRLLTELYARQTRPTSARFGAAQGYARKGKYAWFLDLHPALIAARTVAYSMPAPHTAGYHFLKAYVKEGIQGNPRCPDKKVRRYYRREKLKENLRGLFKL